MFAAGDKGLIDLAASASRRRGLHIASRSHHIPLSRDGGHNDFGQRRPVRERRPTEESEHASRNGHEAHYSRF
jgi:hypothetical protein